MIVSVPPGGWFVDYVDVPPGYTNLTFYATNLPPTIEPQPLEMYEKFGNDPTSTDYDQMELLTNCATAPIRPGLIRATPFPSGRRWRRGSISSAFTIPIAPSRAGLHQCHAGHQRVRERSLQLHRPARTRPLPDDAVSASTITIPNTVTQLVASVNVGLVVQFAAHFGLRVHAGQPDRPARAADGKSGRRRHRTARARCSSIPTS